MWSVFFVISVIALTHVARLWPQQRRNLFIAITLVGLIAWLVVADVADSYAVGLASVIGACLVGYFLQDIADALSAYIRASGRNVAIAVGGLLLLGLYLVSRELFAQVFAWVVFVGILLVGWRMFFRRRN